jgi:hypothetical protein
MSINNPLHKKQLPCRMQAVDSASAENIPAHGTIKMFNEQFRKWCEKRKLDPAKYEMRNQITADFS